jgi:signal peptidase I
MDSLSVLKTILSENGLTIYSLAKSLGISYSVIHDISTGRIKSISRKIAKEITSLYPKYNYNWVIGISETKYSDIKNSDSDTDNSDIGNASTSNTDIEYETLDAEELKEVLSSEGRMIPINIARIPNLELESTIDKLDVPYRNPIEYMPKYDFMYRVLSNAMEPALYTGDIVFVKKSYDKRAINGDCYLVDTIPLGIIIRKVIDNGDSLICTAVNNDCNNLEISKDEVFDIYAIVAILRFNANIHLDDSQSVRKELTIRDKQIDALLDNVNKLIAGQDKLINQNQEVFNINKMLTEELLKRISQ